MQKKEVPKMYLITDQSACSLVSLKFLKNWSIIVFILFWKNLMQFLEKSNELMQFLENSFLFLEKSNAISGKFFSGKI